MPNEACPQAGWKAISSEIFFGIRLRKKQVAHEEQVQAVQHTTIHGHDNTPELEPKVLEEAILAVLSRIMPATTVPSSSPEKSSKS